MLGVEQHCVMRDIEPLSPRPQMKDENSHRHARFAQAQAGHWQHTAFGNHALVQMQRNTIRNDDLRPMPQTVFQPDACCSTFLDKNLVHCSRPADLYSSSSIKRP